MLNKDKVKGFMTGVIITLAASTMLTVFANPIEQAINVVYDNYRIIIDGADKSNVPEDSKPFIYNGRTYVPLRYVGEAMSKKVLWDGDTKSIYINDEGNSREDVNFASQGYEKSDDDIYLNSDTNIVSFNGNAGSSYDEPVEKIIIFNLNGMAKDVLGTIDMSNTENDAIEGKVIFYDQNDKVLYQSSTMRNSTTPISFDFATSGVLQLKVKFISTHREWFTGPKANIQLIDFRYSK